MHEEVKHPCVQHKLALIRDKDTGYKKFRELATEITMFVCYGFQDMIYLLFSYQIS